MKSDYTIERASKKEVEELLLTYHYLKDESKGFKSGYNYGLFRDEILRVGGALGACIFTKLPVPELVVGAFGLPREQQDGLWELSRLCIHPDIQATEYNITSWFVARAIKQFRKEADVKAILSYADSAHHEGTIYKATNFKYYGLSTQKRDFWIEQPDGTHIKHSRGKIKGLKGEWRNRSQKHRFLHVYDKELKKRLRWEELPYPKLDVN